MISDLKTCIDILIQLKNVYETVKSNQDSLCRLITRTLTFQGSIETMIEEELTGSLKKTLESFKEILSDITKFVEKHKEKKLIRSLLNIAFRDNIASSLADFNTELDRCALDFGLIKSIDDSNRLEIQRKEDIQDLKTSFERYTNDLLCEKAKQSSGINPELKQELQVALDAIKTNSESFNEILKAMKQKPLEESERTFISSSLSELGNKIENKLLELKEIVNEVKDDVKEILMMMKLLNDEKLTKDEESMRQRLLNEARIKHADDIYMSKEILGKGGFGQVFLGSYDRNEVAIKVIKGNNISQNMIKEIENEILVMRCVGNHPSILHCYGFVNDEQGIRVVLARAPYGSLDSILYNDKNVISSVQIFEWLCDIIHAIKRVHEYNIKHRDIKAENFLVFENYKLKLCDFGLAREHMTAKVTAGIIAGTQGFIAPELRFDAKCDLTVDIYAFAMTAVQIIKRSPPKEKISASEQIDSAMTFLEQGVNVEIIDLLRTLLKECVEYKQGILAANYRPSAREVASRMDDILKMYKPLPSNASKGIVDDKIELFCALNISSCSSQSTMIKEYENPQTPPPKPPRTKKSTSNEIELEVLSLPTDQELTKNIEEDSRKIFAYYKRKITESPVNADELFKDLEHHFAKADLNSNLNTIQEPDQETANKISLLMIGHFKVTLMREYNIKMEKEEFEEAEIFETILEELSKFMSDNSIDENAISLLTLEVDTVFYLLQVYSKLLNTMIKPVMMQAGCKASQLSFLKKITEKVETYQNKPTFDPIESIVSKDIQSFSGLLNVVHSNYLNPLSFYINKSKFSSFDLLDKSDIKNNSTLSSDPSSENINDPESTKPQEQDKDVNTVSEIDPERAKIIEQFKLKWDNMSEIDKKSMRRSWKNIWKDLDKIKFMIEVQGFRDIYCKDKYNGGLNVMMKACHKGNLNIVKYLIENKTCPFTNLYDKDNEGDNVLMYSCYYGHLNIVKYLIENKTCPFTNNIHDIDKFGRNIYDLADTKEIRNYLSSVFPGIKKNKSFLFF